MSEQKESVMVAHEPQQVDDRNELVTIHYGKNPVQVEQLPKKDAVNKLFTYHINRRTYEKAILKHITDAYGNLLEVNNAACYVKIKKVNNTGLIREYYKDLPMWILVERMLNDQKYLNADLVTKQEYDQWLAEQAKKEAVWVAPGNLWNTTGPNLKPGVAPAPQQEEKK